MQRFDGLTALITGGAAGIGRATAIRLAEEGARVALVDSSESDLADTLQTLSLSGAEAIGVCADVRDPVSAPRAVTQVLAAWGRLDVLVANAAMRHYGAATQAEERDWDAVLGVNLKGAAFACAAAADAMRPGGGGAMVLVSSVHAVVGRGDMPLYDASKAALLSLTRSLAVELAPQGVRVNSLCPGFTVTDFHIRRTRQTGGDPESLRRIPAGLLGRPAEPAEIAAAIAFLASHDASYVTGTNLMVDGGRHSA